MLIAPPLNKKVKYIILPVDHRAVTALAVQVAVRFSNKFDRLIVMALAYGALPPALPCLGLGSGQLWQGSAEHGRGLRARSQAAGPPTEGKLPPQAPPQPHNLLEQGL